MRSKISHHFAEQNNNDPFALSRHLPTVIIELFSDNGPAIEHIFGAQSSFKSPYYSSTIEVIRYVMTV